MIDIEYSALVINGWNKLDWPYIWSASGKGPLRHSYAVSSLGNLSYLRQDLDEVLCQIFPHRRVSDVV
jgi:CRISPR/Cas system CMR subunit Cmr4 (Cas7 group RAMP superfamily)